VRISESAVALSAFGASDIGRVRDANEDTFICDVDRALFAVIDGVGGHAGGEVAAAIARRELDLRLRRETGTVEDRIREAIAAANASILAEAERVPGLAQMACVLTCAVVTPNEVVIGHVGDTRLYKLGPAGIHKLTHDHSPVGQLEDRGQLDEKEAMRHPERNQVFREVGTRLRQPTDGDFIEIITAPLGADEAILLCTDGLSDLVTSSEIEAIVRREPEPSQAVTTLLAAANAAGGRDNITVVMAAGPLFGGPSAFASRWSGDTRELIRAGETRAGVASAADAAGPRAPRTVFVSAAGIVMLATAILWPTEVLSPDTAVPVATARVLQVSEAGRTGFSSIGAALKEAQAGDVIDVDAGTYAETIVLKEGVSVRAQRRRTVVLEQPADADGPWTAISATAIRSALLSGFVIKGTSDSSLQYGVLVTDAHVELDDLEIAGARAAAVQIAGRSTARLRSSNIHDNPGAGVVVEGSASPEILHNVIAGNGRTPPLRPGIELRPGARAVIGANIIRGNGVAITGAAPPELSRIQTQNAIEKADGTATR
jgi:serine/threonine protein phosphatase PrpC